MTRSLMLALIMNRPFYHIEEGTYWRGDFAVNIQTTTTEFFLKENCAYAVNIDGTEYGFRMPYDQDDDALRVRFEMDNAQILEILTYKGVKEARIYCFDEGCHDVSVYERVNEQLLQLDEKFIPDTIARVNDLPVGEGTTTSMVTVFDENVEIDEEYGSCDVDLSNLERGKVYTITTTIYRTDERYDMEWNGSFSIYSKSADIDINIYPTYITASQPMDARIKIETEEVSTVVKQLDEKYIPDTIARSAESHGLAMDDVSGEFVSAAEFNALLAILRDAGYLASSGATVPF